MSATFIRLDIISRIEFISILFFTKAAVVKIAVTVLTTNVRKAKAKVIFTPDTRFEGMLSTVSRKQTKIDDRINITAARNKSATRTELNIFDDFSTSPLWYAIEINLPEIEFKAVVTMVAYCTIMFIDICFPTDFGIKRSPLKIRSVSVPLFCLYIPLIYFFPLKVHCQPFPN